MPFFDQPGITPLQHPEKEKEKEREIESLPWLAPSTPPRPLTSDHPQSQRDEKKLKIINLTDQIEYVINVQINKLISKLNFKYCLTILCLMASIMEFKQSKHRDLQKNSKN